jgi:L-threonylcarbamoyladenylate synthase
MNKKYNIEPAVIDVLKSGGIMLYPSDTIWGLGCDATNEEACQKIIQIKKRKEEKSFIVLMDSIQMLEKYVPDFHPVCYDLIDLATSPLTIIYPTAKNLAPSILAAEGTVAIRITKDPLCLALIQTLKKPLVSTSANLSGDPHPTCYNDISHEIIAGSTVVLEERLHEKMTTPSKIIKIDLDGTIKVIRK